MEEKKKESANLENKKVLFFIVGLSMILSASYAAISLKSYMDEAYDFEMIIEDDLEELPPITTPPPPPPPPPKEAKPPVQPDIEVVEDEVETDEPEFNDDDLAEIEVEDEPIGDEPEEVIEDIPLTFVSNMPYLPECSSLTSNMQRDQCTKRAIANFIRENFDTPDIAREMEYSDMIFVKFVVGKNGKVREAEILKGKYDILNAEALKTVRKIPNLIPGSNMDRPVSVIYNIPIKIEYD